MGGGASTQQTEEIQKKDETIQQLKKQLDDLKTQLNAEKKKAATTMDKPAGTTSGTASPGLSKSAVRVNRRLGVAAEPSSAQVEVKKVPKSQAIWKIISSALSDSLLFSDLSQELRDAIIDTMFPKEFKAGDKVFMEGDFPCDLFYVVESGTAEVLVTTPAGDQTLAATLEVGSSFGDLALMYNAPRAATVKCTSNVVLWAADRLTFSHLITQAHNKERQEYITNLEKIPLLKSLQSEVLHKLADVLVPDTFEDSEYLIRQGNIGDRFYIIVEGEVSVRQKGEDGVEKELSRQKAGGWVGERALLTDEKRAASVLAIGRVRCLSLERRAFIDLLGPLDDLKNAEGPERVSVTLAPMQYRGLTMSDIDDIARIGCGSFGVVKLVRTKDKKIHALKGIRSAALMKHGLLHLLRNEVQALRTFQTPFTVHLLGTLRDEANVYMLLDYCPGGELFTLMQSMGKFSEGQAKFYVASVVLAFECIHNQGYVYRDLKPENLLLDSRGYLKVADFGFAKKVSDKTFTRCGTPDYMAPEIIQGKGHNKAVDYWSVGILIFELLCGFAPFSESDPMQTYRNILSGVIVFPRHMSKNAVDIIHKLCKLEPQNRLGCLKDGVLDVKRHRWFQGFDWDGLAAQTLTPPMCPDVSRDGINNFSCPTSNPKIYDLSGNAPLDPAFVEEWDAISK